MPDEPIAETELETASEIEQTEPEQPELIEGEAAEGQQPQPEDEEEEFDWNGKKIRGPKGLKDGVLMAADYTRKTQEVAATKRELDQRAEYLNQQAQLSEQDLKVHASLAAIDAELARFQEVDWEAWRNSDFIAAQSARDRMNDLKEARQQASGYLYERHNARTVEAQQDTAKRLQETRQYAQTNIKGWTPEVDVKLASFAKAELGFDDRTLIGALTPQVYRALHLAWLGHQTLSKPTSAAKPVPQAQPLRVVAAKANAPAAKPLDAMSMDEYAAVRAKQMAAAAARR